jgi:hypothetical protein
MTVIRPTPLKTILLSLVLFCELAGGVEAAGPSGAKSDYGGEAPARAADYRISISAATRWVNVNNGDTVQFEAGGKEFTWHFRTFKGTKIFNLSLIAPAGMQVGATRVFVAQNVFEID